MGHFLLVLTIIIVVVLVVRREYKRRSQPEYRLMKDFGRLKDSVLDGLERSDRKAAKELLKRSEEHLKALLKAREQHDLINNMESAASEMVGQKITSRHAGSQDRFDQEVAKQLSTFFADLAKIATVTGFRQSETLEDLRSFTDSLEARRDVLFELNRFEEELEKEQRMTMPERVDAQQKVEQPAFHTK